MERNGNIFRICGLLLWHGSISVSCMEQLSLKVTTAGTPYGCINFSICLLETYPFGFSWCTCTSSPIDLLPALRRGQQTAITSLGKERHGLCEYRLHPLPCLLPSSGLASVATDIPFAQIFALFYFLPPHKHISFQRTASLSMGRVTY